MFSSDKDKQLLCCHILIFYIKMNLICVGENHTLYKRASLLHLSIDLFSKSVSHASEIPISSHDVASVT